MNVAELIAILELYDDRREVKIPALGGGYIDISDVSPATDFNPYDADGDKPVLVIE